MRSYFQFVGAQWNGRLGLVRQRMGDDHAERPLREDSGASTREPMSPPATMVGVCTFSQPIIIGLIVGAVAKLLMPGRDPGGWIVTILLGLAGSLVANYL